MNIKGSHQFAHLCSLIRTFPVSHSRAQLFKTNDVVSKRDIKFSNISYMKTMAFFCHKTIRSFCSSFFSAKAPHNFSAKILLHKTKALARHTDEVTDSFEPLVFAGTLSHLIAGHGSDIGWTSRYVLV